MLRPSLSTLFIVGFSFSIFVSCDNKKKEVKPVEVTFKKEGELMLYKEANDSLVVKLDIEIADTDYDIQTGLMYRSSMQDNRGMLFVFPEMRQRYFYMRNTKFPLDLIFVDDNNRIVSFQENAKPFDESSLPSDVPAQYVLEVNAGLAEKWSLDIGDRMEYTKID